MKLRFMLNSLWALIVIAIRGGLPALASTVHADAPEEGRHNVLFITCDQRMYQPAGGPWSYFREPLHFVGGLHALTRWDLHRPRPAGDRDSG